MIPSRLVLISGGFPYPGIKNSELTRLLKKGYRMEKPDTCSEEWSVTFILVELVGGSSSLVNFVSSFCRSKRGFEGYYYTSFKKITFPRGNYQAIVLRQKHSFILLFTTKFSSEHLKLFFNFS